MQQRDILKDQIEQLGRVLGKIIADFLGRKAQGEVGRALEETHQALQTALGMDPDELLNWSAVEMEAWVNDRQWSSAQIDTLARYYYEAGAHRQDREGGAHNRFETARILLKLSEERSDTLTFDRMELKRLIDDALNNHTEL